MLVFVLLVLGAILAVCPVVRCAVLHPFAVAVNGCKDMVQYFRHKEYNNAKTGELVAYTGLFGKGKTLSAVHRVVTEYHRFNGRMVWCPRRKKMVTQRVHVISNVALSVPYENFVSLEQIVLAAERSAAFDDAHDTLTITLVLGDEFSVQMNSRNFKTNIDPLFLNDLRQELDDILEEKVERQRNRRLDAFQDKLAALTFLDPACGSGNFLTETYLSLRRLENELIRERYHGQSFLALDGMSPVKVNINQFYGIEINDFAVTVATTALWISEAQMLAETERIINHEIDFLPLKSYTNIVEGNALRVDWESVVSKEKLNYIIGNPPFVGFTFMDAEQKKDVANIYPGIKNIDFVSCWFKKANDYTISTNIRSCFVSTNSITQGETVGRMWERLSVKIDFAYKTFRWDNEASDKAHVHCVIIGFSHSGVKKKLLFSDYQVTECENINPYLMDAPNVVVKSRNKPIHNVPPMIYGNKPADGGYLILTKEEREELLKSEPKAKKWVHRLIGSIELINNHPSMDDKVRYCLWLEGITPTELKSMPKVLNRVEECKNKRLSSPAAAIRKFAETPYLFAQRTQPEITPLDEEGKPIYESDGAVGNNLLIPRVSSEKRKYVPMGYFTKEIVTNDAVQIIPNATLYHFGILESNVHMAWMRAVCGRLEMRYRYSKDIVYNNFPWPEVSDEQQAKIAQTAQGILDARAKYPNSSLADLYDELTMPPELRKAHQANDRAVMQAYGFDVKTMTESQCVAELFKMYQRLTVES